MVAEDCKGSVKWLVCYTSGMTHHYADGQAPVLEHIIKNKKDVLLDLFKRNSGKWISRIEISNELDRYGMEMNQVTARISDLRDDLFLENLFIDSRQVDANKGHWEYKLDDLTSENREEYLRRRNSKNEDERLIEFLNNEIKNLKRKIDDAPAPYLDSPLSLSEWDESYEKWYSSRYDT